MRQRVLFAPRNISGQATEYLESIRPFGFDGEVWSYGPPAFGFSADRVIDPDRLLADPSYRWDLFDQAVRSFDIFHLQYSRSLLPPEGVVLPELWDLPLLRSLGKRVVMSFRGSDVRIPSEHRRREPDSYLAHQSGTIDEDRIRSRIAICRRFCDAMLVSTPGLLDDVPDAQWLPHVIDVTTWEAPRDSERAVPVVLHIPSSRATKGSEVIDAEIGALAGEGHIEYRSLADLSRSELREAVRSADLVIDSLTIGDHGLISVEAMAAGAIPIAHISKANRERNPGVPVVEATIHSLRDVVRRLAGDPEARQELRRTCAAFVRERHDRSVIGPELADLYRAPRRPVDRAYPQWPRTDHQRRVAALEARIDELEADVDPVVRGFGSFRSTLPRRVADQLLGRISALEAEIAELRGEAHPDRGRRHTRPSSPDLRDRLKANPRLHRLVRVARRHLLRARKR